MDGGCAAAGIPTGCSPSGFTPLEAGKAGNDGTVGKVWAQPRRNVHAGLLFCFFFFFGGLLFVLESSLSLFIWLGRISILLPFTSIKTACQVTGFDDGVTFSACRKPIHFLVFGGGGERKAAFDEKQSLKRHG